MPVGFPKVPEFQKQPRHAESVLFMARHAYVEHMAHCLTCSGTLVLHDAILIIQERLKRVSEESTGHKTIRCHSMASKVMCELLVEPLMLLNLNS
jgi:hypothetical protein